MIQKSKDSTSLNSVSPALADLMPDVAKERPDLTTMSGALDWVGMRGIEVPLLLRDQQGHIYRTAARAGTWVSLENQESRGIHMSRLFKDLQEELSKSALDFPVLARVLEKFLASHEELSEKAKLEIDFQALVERKALKSDNKGWRTYPVKISGLQQKGREPRFYLETVVTYSSTCPASAALSRQLIQENFKDHFRGQNLDFKEVFEFLGTTRGIVATPHAQRSEARVKVEVAARADFNFESLVELIEHALQTPVQTVVKREDEQAFALRNGQNLMFCEDAARRVQAALLKEASVVDFIAQMAHLESLHPHDAVSTVSRGLELRSFE
jgi:GTP cyclohydrolase I